MEVRMLSEWGIYIPRSEKKDLGYYKVFVEFF